ncbi:LysR family transcriptional regulator [Rhodobacteraceae bacterium B1Z28]|uniref:LysR family transcriptional regulator n=1 Tax=Ruegeria haliotis TaxID=2747601 RepID=A0ABX2PTE9_9RHOB|nr:LysR family transcriptional regulator [Ruegeria haliotis]NVO56941.1 LysR family transcriptional regulator [Ruegeria haliotis]
MALNLRALETFVEVADCLSFTDAGRRLGLPAATVTTRIKSLEAQLGVRLLDRSTRTVAVTAEGQIFLAHSQKALHELMLASEAVGAAQETSGQVRVSIPAAFPMDQFARVVGKFCSAYPDISIKIHVDDRPASFIEDGVDLALRGGAPGGDGLIARHLRDTEVIFVGPLERLADDSLPVLRPLAKRIGTIDKRNGPSTRSLQLSLAFVANGQARAYLPRSICKEALAAAQMEEGSGPDGLHDPLPLFLVYHDKQHQPKRVQLFKDILIQEFALSAHET